MDLASSTRLFDWAESSRKSLVVFIDEADAFLQSRAREVLSEDTRAAFNAFLFRLERRVVALCWWWRATSQRPSIGPSTTVFINWWSSLFRDERSASASFYSTSTAHPATEGARGQRLKLADFDWVKKCSEVADKTDGLSGRELSKLVVGWQGPAYGSEDGVLTPAMIDSNTADAVKQHKHNSSGSRRSSRNCV